jgi:hypothetical protein
LGYLKGGTLGFGGARADEVQPPGRVAGIRGRRPWEVPAPCSWRPCPTDTMRHRRKKGEGIEMGR